MYIISNQAIHAGTCALLDGVVNGDMRGSDVEFIQQSLSNEDATDVADRTVNNLPLCSILPALIETYKDPSLVSFIIMCIVVKIKLGVG